MRPLRPSLADAGEEDGEPSRAGESSWVYDPRFLVFEFLLGFMLRKRQFELVSWFTQLATEHRSSVNQM